MQVRSGPGDQQLMWSALSSKKGPNPRPLFSSHAWLAAPETSNLVPFSLNTHKSPQRFPGVRTAVLKAARLDPSEMRKHRKRAGGNEHDVAAVHMTDRVLGQTKDGK